MAVPRDPAQKRPDAPPQPSSRPFASDARSGPETPSPRPLLRTRDGHADREAFLAPVVEQGVGDLDRLLAHERRPGGPWRAGSRFRPRAWVPSRTPYVTRLLYNAAGSGPRAMRPAASNRHRTG